MRPWRQEVAMRRSLSRPCVAQKKEWRGTRTRSKAAALPFSKSVPDWSATRASLVTVSVPSSPIRSRAMTRVRGATRSMYSADMEGSALSLGTP